MNKMDFKMESEQIAQIMGTVGSPLIVIAELIKNAVDISAKKIDVYYSKKDKEIIVKNDYKGFSISEIEKIYKPGLSSKKKEGYIKNDQGGYLTGSKGLGLLSVFLLCNKAEIYTVSENHKEYKIIMERDNGTVDVSKISDKEIEPYTKIILTNVDEEIISLLSSEAEIRKLRHICTYLYKRNVMYFPDIVLHIPGEKASSVNFACAFPPMSYNITFEFNKEKQELNLSYVGSDNDNKGEISFNRFDIESLKRVLKDCCHIENPINTRTNIEQLLEDFSYVPSFEGRILVYEQKNAGKELKTYGPGVNIYINDYALYNYLAEENDWLGLADFSQRKKATRLKPHNVFGYVNFPCFNESNERLRISNERADFIQDMIYLKLMYLLKGVVMFAIFNIDVADKEKRHNKVHDNGDKKKDNIPAISNEELKIKDEELKIKEDHNSKGNNIILPVPATDLEDSTQGGSCKGEQIYAKDSVVLQGKSISEEKYAPRKSTSDKLEYTVQDGEIIKSIQNNSELGKKINAIVYELSKLSVKNYPYSNAFLFRTLIESATLYASTKEQKIAFTDKALETSVGNALDYFSNNTGKGKKIEVATKQVRAWREAVQKRKLIDLLNGYIHKDYPVDEDLILGMWSTMKSYIIACIKLI